MNEVRTIYVEMPPAIKGYLVKMFDDGEDYYTIVINPCYNREQQLETYEHELRHLKCYDLDDFCDVDVIERMRHG